jgi:hypothetical protein
MMRMRWCGIVDKGRAVGLALTASVLFLTLVVATGPLAAAPPALPALLGPTAAKSDAGPAAAPGARPHAVLRQRVAEVRPGVLTSPDGSPAAGVGQRIELNLFDDAKFAMTISDVTRHTGGGYTWSGTLDGIDHGSAILAVRDGAVAGQIIMPQAVYRIGYASDGTPVVEQIDHAALPPEAHSIAPALGAADDNPSSNVGAELPDVAADTASQIDVMVLYTPAARAFAGGSAAMRAQVDLAVSLANQAYGNTNLVQRLRLVYAGEIKITEHTGPNSFLDDLEALNANPTVAWLRNVTRADVVSLITEHGPTSPFCGIGYLMTANSSGFAPLAFSVAERVCATNILTFVHEIGHNMGAHHDPLVSVGEPTLFPYSHGHVDVVGAFPFRTVMAYSDQCGAISCPRIVAFSSPLFTFQGRVIGTAAVSDNSRTLGQTGNTVANFSQALVAPPTASTGVNQTVFSAGNTLVVSVGLSNPGRTGTADIYFGLLAPDNSVAFFTNVTITPSSGFAFGNLLNFASYRPIATGVPLATPFSVNIPSFVSYTFTGGEPRGGYALLLLVVTAGALADGVLAPNELLAASLTPFSFPP